MKRQALFISMFLLMMLTTNAQEICGTELLVPNADYEDMSPLGLSNSNFTSKAIIDKDKEHIIPVIFYIYNFNDMDANVVQDQLDILNKEFQDDFSQHLGLDVKFCLATARDGKPLPTPYAPSTTAVTQYNDKGLFWIEDGAVNNTLGVFSQSAHDFLSNTTGSLDEDRYIRIYVFNTSSVSSGGSSLSSIVPPYLASTTHKLIILHTEHTPAALNNIGFSDGDVLVHEVGHYMGLLHVFHGFTCSGSTPYNCNVDGDKICDTSPMLQPATGACAVNPLTVCNNFPQPTVRVNHMDYSADNCRDLFTQLQTDVMGYQLFYGEHNLLTQQKNQDYTLPYCEKVCNNCEPYHTTYYKSALSSVQNTGLDDSYLFPNPTKSDVNVVIPSSVNDEFTITVVSSFGQVLTEESISSQGTETKYTFSSAEFSNGIYFVKVASKSGDLKILKLYKTE